jgi:Ig-like domain-containing protein
MIIADINRFTLNQLFRLNMERRMNTTSIIRISKITVLSLLIFASACSPLVVIVQPTSVASSPTALPPIALTSTLEPTAFLIPSPTAISQPTATSTLVSTACHDSAQYISDDGLDGTTYPPNTPFTKTWTVKNTGTCTWDSSYLVFQISGTLMTQQPGYWIVPQGQTVAPGQSIDIGVGMVSPVENGNYASYWGLKKADGQFIPIQGGANGNSFYVKIKVNNGAAVGKVTASAIAIELEQGSGAVCTANSTYFVHASITVDGATTATYEIDSTAGQIPAGNFQDANNGLSPYVTGSVAFDQAGTKTINLRFIGPYPYPDDITVNLRVNGGEWHNTKLSCR